MGSRIRDNVKHLFQCFCEVVGQQSPDKEAWIIQKFPESYRDEEVLKSVPKFAYPCDFPNTIVQHYSFVLTSIDSKWTFGFCRHDPKTETALVLLSYLPWHESFYKLLNHIAEINYSSKSDELWKFLESVYNSSVPDAGRTLQIPFNNGRDTFVCPCPNQFQLPSIPENRNLTEYYNAVDGHNMMVIFASMLYERRIIFTSKKLYRLSACVQSANSIIYPMNWQHIFIPVLPMALMDYLLAPMPYLIGVPEVIYQRVRKADLGDVVVLDADSNKVETPFQDLESLPLDVVTSLRRQLRNRAALLGDGVSRAFLRALVQLIGGYRDALKFHQGQKITFSPDAFIESRPSSMQPFLRKMLQLQIFQQFIEDRLEMLNNGLGFSDEFEMEACNYSDKSSSKLKQQYKEWAYTMRKEGSAFFKTMKNKVKERGKDVRTAYKGIRSKLRDMQPREGLGSREDGLNESSKGDKPRSAPTSPINRRRPQTFAGPKATAAASFRKDPLLQRKNTVTTNRSRPYSPLSPSSDPGSPDVLGKSCTDTPGLQLSPLDMDLMGDLQDVIFRKCSSILDTEETKSPPIDRTLKPVCSLESFKHSGDNWWSPPSQSPRLGAPMSSPTLASNSGYDLFGSTPFVVGGGGSVDGDPVFVVASPSSVDLVRLPPPQSHGSKKEGGDLIRLDSTPSDEDFDPLYAKDKPLTTHSVNQTLPIATEGLTNPLYPYFVPTVGKSSSTYAGNQSFLHSQSQRRLNVAGKVPEQRVQNSSVGQTYGALCSSSSSNALIPGQYNVQDMDLLKEYGLDFKALSFKNGGPALRPTPPVSLSSSSPAMSSVVARNPFENLVDFPDSAVKSHSKNQWTKFD
ncbi:DENN domain-containing protein 1B isoform X2 [Cryptotermes secundus]|uniref:DENN domain-containing protein 1B isoform X2 n=1 Tax=Cryptotermes secundus TaxID=105785 RepID=UPI001454D798|nr:DENN domain-containing protein 1B isoform X2 [Cryptotermes secundus]